MYKNESFKKLVVTHLNKRNKKVKALHLNIRGDIINKVKNIDFYRVDNRQIKMLADNDRVCCTSEKFYYTEELESLDVDSILRIVIVEITNYFYSYRYLLGNVGIAGDYQFILEKIAILASFNLHNPDMSVFKIKALMNSVNGLSTYNFRRKYEEWVEPYEFKGLPEINTTKIGTNLYMNWNTPYNENIELLYDDGERHIVFMYNFLDVGNILLGYSTITHNKSMVCYNASENLALEYGNPISKEMIENIELMQEFKMG